MKRTIFLMIVTSLLSACGFEQVDEGYRGIKTTFGKVEAEPYMPGLHFYNPISSSMFEMDVREQKLENETACFTKDTQTVRVKYAVTYYPEPSKIAEIYSQFGKAWEDKILTPAVLGSIKDSIGQYIADDLVSKREAVKASTQKELIEALAQRNVHVTRLDIIDLDFEEAYEQAVERKVVAIQNAQESKNQTMKVKEEALQAIERAKAEAESMRIRANALSQNKSLVEYEAVQKWDGKLPQQMFGGNAVPFIDLRGVSK